SPTASTVAIALSSSAASESTRTTRPGCSVCADRTSPHTAAPARSGTSSPANPIAPLVATISTPESCSVSHDCTAASARCVRSYDPETGSSPAATDSNTWNTGGSVLAAVAVAGDQTTSNSRSGPEADTAACSCRSLTG